MASATSRRRRGGGDHLHHRAPPPTPIATGKGSRSAAVDDRVLTEYLETSLRVPHLTLPELPASASPSPSSTRSLRRRIPEQVDLRDLSAGDGAELGRLIASATDLGAVVIVDGHDVTGEEVRSVRDSAGEVLFRMVSEEKRRKRYFRRRDGGREEFRWFRPPVSSEDDAVLRDICGPAHAYWAIREKLDSICIKLERVADCIGEILCRHATRNRDPQPDNGGDAAERHSILYLRRYDFRHFGDPDWDDKPDKTTDYSKNHAFSLHLLGDNREFSIRSAEEEEGGSVPFTVPSDSIVVTLAKQFQEWSNGEFKGVTGDPIYELSKDLKPSFSLEFQCSPSAQSHKVIHITKTIPLMDQLLTALVFLFLYKLWTHIFP